MPTSWYNLRADMPEKPDPMLLPDGTVAQEAHIQPVFCSELAHQELDDETRYVDIPEEVLDIYKIYRPSPLCRAYELEKALGTPAKIYYKFEGNNTSGSHKLNSAVAQAYYAKKEGLVGLTTETGAGQWGTAMAEAASYFGLECKVFMVKVSYEQKPFQALEAGHHAAWGAQRQRDFRWRQGRRALRIRSSCAHRLRGSKPGQSDSVRERVARARIRA
jgi:tryptophan synthase beta chain